MAGEVAHEEAADYQTADALRVEAAAGVHAVVEVVAQRKSVVEVEAA